MSLLPMGSQGKQSAGSKVPRPGRRARVLEYKLRGALRVEEWVLLEELVGKFFSLLGFSLDLLGIFLFISSVKGSLTKFLPKPPLQGPP